MVAFFDNIGYIAPVIGVVVFFVVIMVVRKLMAGTPDTKEKAKKSDDEDEKKDSDDEKKDSKDEDEKKDPEEIEKKLVEDLDVEAGIVHKLKTDVTIEQDEADFDEALDSEVVGDIQAETAAIKEEASAEQRHNAAAEKKAMEHEKKTIGTLETDLEVIATQFKQNIGDEQKLNGDFGTAIEKLGKLNLRMSNLILSADPDNAEPNTGDRMGNIRSLDRKIKATEQSSQQIINSIETVINRVRADIQGVKSSYSPQAHETLKKDLETLSSYLGAEFQKIATVRRANKEELEKIEEIFEESVTGLEKFKKKSKVL